MRFGTYHAGWSIVWIALTVSALTGCGGGDDESAAAAPTQDGTIGPPAAPRVPAPPAPAATAPPTTGNRAATLTWAAPTQYENGSPFVDLAGYRIWYGNAPGSYSRLVEIAPGTTTHNILNLAATTYFFSMTAYNQEASRARYGARGRDEPELVARMTTYPAVRQVEHA